MRKCLRRVDLALLLSVFCNGLVSRLLSVGIRRRLTQDNVQYYSRQAVNPLPDKADNTLRAKGTCVRASPRNTRSATSQSHLITNSLMAKQTNCTINANKQWVPPNTFPLLPFGCSSSTTSERDACGIRGVLFIADSILSFCDKQAISQIAGLSWCLRIRVKLR